MARADALYESGMPLDALNLPPSVSTHDHFDVSDDQAYSEETKPRKRVVANCRLLLV